jgi:hypothetical protein
MNATMNCDCFLDFVVQLREFIILTQHRLRFEYSFNPCSSLLRSKLNNSVQHILNMFIITIRVLEPDSLSIMHCVEVVYCHE